MTSGMTGMNVEEVQNLGRQLQTHGENLRNLVNQLEAAVNGATWLGQDATQFKTQWWPEHKGQLTQVAQGLHDFGQSALNNASDQINASSH
jgi:hypothetical protein